MWRQNMGWVAVGCGAVLLLLGTLQFTGETVSGQLQRGMHRRLATHSKDSDEHHEADDGSTEADKAHHKKRHPGKNDDSTHAVKEHHKMSHHGADDDSTEADEADHKKSAHKKHQVVDDSAKIEDGKSEKVKQPKKGDGEIGLHDCIDDQRAHLNFTNKTCVTREMLLLGDPLPAFYLVCGVNASLLKDAKFNSITTVGKELLELMLYAFLSGIIPLMLSSLVFQSLHSKDSKTDESASPSCWTQFTTFVGTAGTYLTLPVLVGLNLYTTTMTTGRFVSEVMEFHSSLHYSWSCNFSLTLDYATHGDVLGVLVLAAFSWSDLVFNVGKILWDCWLLLSSFCWSTCDYVKYICCCKWIPWHWIKILCCCSGPCACLKLLGSLICQYILLLLCAIPLVIALVLIEVVLFAAIAYAAGGLAVVFGVYACVGLCAGAILLLVVYTGTLPIQSTMWCLGFSKEFDTPCSFYQGALDRFTNELGDHKNSPFSLLSTDEKEASSQGAFVRTVSKIIKNKLFALLLPAMILLAIMLMQVVSFLFMQIHSMTIVDEETSLKLSQKVAGSWTQQAQNLWAPIPNIFVETNSFVYEYLIVKIMEVPHMLQLVKEYLDPEELITAAATLLDLKAKFHQLQKAVLAMRVGSGLLMGPLKLFEALARYDVK